MIKNVRIAIRDTTDSHNVGFFDQSNGIKYDSAELTRFLKGACSFLTIKYYSKDIDIVTVGCKLAFRYKNVDYWLTINDIKKDKNKIELTAYSLSLEANKEKCGSFKAPNAMSFEQYLIQFDPERSFVIGINEVSDQRVSAEWIGTDTVLARLYSVAEKFDAELEFVTELSEDYSLKKHVVNVYKNGNLGKVKTGTPIRVGKDLEVINCNSNINELYTAIRCKGKDGLTINGLDRKVLDVNGEVLFYTFQDVIFAPQSRDRFPSISNRNTDGYIVYEANQTEHSTIDGLYAYMLGELKKHCEPKNSYETIGSIDGNVGDTVTLLDDVHYDPPLYLQARISERTESLLTDSQDKVTFVNFERKQSQLADDLVKRVEELEKSNNALTNDVRATVEQIVKPLIEPKADANITNEMLNALQEQSQQVQESVEARATKLEFDEFVRRYTEASEKLALGTEEAKAALARQADRLIQIQHNLGEMAERWKFLDTDITLSEEGVRIGNVAKDSYVLVGSDRISFFSGGNEVMYISQGVLHIDNGIFTNSIRIGDYVQERYTPAPRKNVVRYVGGV